MLSNCPEMSGFGTSDFKQCCLVGNIAQECRPRLFQDSDLAADLEDSNSTSGEILCIFGSHTFVPMNWMCTVTRSSTESDVTSLDASLRMDGIPALDLWDLVLKVLNSSSTQVQGHQERARGNLQRNKQSSKHTNTQIKIPVQQNDLELTNVDYVSSNAKSSRSGAMRRQRSGDQDDHQTQKSKK